MHIVIIALTLLAAVLLIGIVLIQKSKGGGLSSQFGGAGSVMGVRQTNSFLEKATWTLVGVLAVLSVVSSYTAGTRTNTGLRAVPTEQSAPAATLPAPGQTAAPAAVEIATPAADIVEVEVPAAAETETPAE